MSIFIISFIYSKQKVILNYGLSKIREILVQEFHKSLNSGPPKPELSRP